MSTLPSIQAEPLELSSLEDEVQQWVDEKSEEGDDIFKMLDFDCMLVGIELVGIRLGIPLQVSPNKKTRCRCHQIHKVLILLPHLHHKSQWQIQVWLLLCLRVQKRNRFRRKHHKGRNQNKWRLMKCRRRDKQWNILNHLPKILRFKLQGLLRLRLQKGSPHNRRQL